MLGLNQSINQGLFSIQTNNNNNIHTFANMNTERAGNEVILNETIDQLAVASSVRWYGHVPRMVDGHVPRMVDSHVFEVEGQLKKGGQTGYGRSNLRKKV